MSVARIEGVGFQAVFGCGCMMADDGRVAVETGMANVDCCVGPTAEQA